MIQRSPAHAARDVLLTYLERLDGPMRGMNDALVIARARTEALEAARKVGTDEYVERVLSVTPSPRAAYEFELAIEALDLSDDVREAAGA